MLTDIESLIESVKEPTLFFGDAISIYRSHIEGKERFAKLKDGNDWYPRGEVVARLGLEKFLSGIKENADKLVPMYMYPNECAVRGFK